MSMVTHFLIAIAVMAFLGGGVAWIAARKAKSGDEDAVTLAIKIALTLILIPAAFVAIPVFSFFGVFLIVFCGVIFSVLWAPSIGAWLSRPLTSAIDGGDRPSDPAPQYSRIEARRKRGDYAGAVTELRRELARFPDDFDGQLMLASIQAENLSDLDRARMTIERVVHQMKHSPHNRAYALTQMADWELGRGGDPEAARQILERIQQLFPGTEMSVGAAQRIARLPGIDASSPSGKPLGHPNPSAEGNPDSTLQDTEAKSDALTRHLAGHPLDAEARQELARLYCEKLERTDLAISLYETMIGQPNHPPRQIAQWLEQIADIQARYNGDLPAATAALQRIVEMFPGTALADAAANRQGMIIVRPRHGKISRTVTLGSYEDDVGLKS